MQLSIFTDELGMDFAKGLPYFREWSLGCVDFRGNIMGGSIETLSDAQLRDLRRILDDNGMKTGCLQSSLGKVHLPGPEELARQQAKLDGLLRAAELLDCRLVRSFFFWQPQGGQEDSGLSDFVVRPDIQEQVLSRFRPFAQRAREAGLRLAFENCGCTKEDCFKLLDLLDIPEWGIAWDPKNSWMRDKQEREQDLDAYLKKMAARTINLHVKSTGTIWFDGQFDAIPYDRVFAALADAGYDGLVSIETHNFNPGLSAPEACRQVIQVVRRAWPAAASGAQQERCALQAGTLVRPYADDPVRFGVVGLGMGHNRALEMVKTSGIKLVQVCDLVAERRERTSEACAVPAVAEYAEMLRNPAIEAVMVLNETGRHMQLARQALEAGTHVLVTKPMDMDPEKCLETMRFAKSAGLLLGVDHCRRLRPSVQSLKAAQEHGFFGRMLSASVTLKVRRTMDYFRENGGWRGTRALDGGVLSNQTVHHLDELLFVFGMPEAVRCDCWTQDHDIECEDLGLAVWRYADGMVVNICATTSYPQSSWYYQMELHGTEGAYVHREGGPGSRPESRYFKDAWTDAAPYPRECGWLNSMDNFASAIRRHTQLLTTAEGGRNAVRLIQAMYDSADHGGKWVMLPSSQP